MKTSIFAALLTVILSMALPSTAWAGGPRGGRGGMQGNANACTVLTEKTLSQAEVDTLMYMREEEKMARDLYISFNELYGTTVRVFGNISRSEQKHMDAVKGLLDDYGLTDPVVDDAVGKFTNPELLGQYEKLLAKGNTLKGALEVGILVEEQDLEDLAAAMNETDEPCIRSGVFQLAQGLHQPSGSIQPGVGSVLKLTTETRREAGFFMSGSRRCLKYAQGIPGVAKCALTDRPDI